MKNEELSLQRKQLLAASLKKHMQQKPLSKITISEIVADCAINRKTFYYHFPDTYTLFKWLLEQEALEIVKQFDLLTNPEDAINFIIDYVEHNQHILNCAYNGVGQDELRYFFYQSSVDVVYKLIADTEKELGLSVQTSFKKFLSVFFSEALAGTLIDYFHDTHTIDREEFVYNLVLTCKTSMIGTLTKKANK